jgi:hypothetical protein
MVTSHGSMPAAHTAAAISRSPLEPSSRITATRTWVAAGREGGGEWVGKWVGGRVGGAAGA